MIDEAIKIAKRSSCRRFLVGCVLVKDEEILSSGWAHMSQMKLKEVPSVHAELHALLRARHLDLTGCTAYIATIAGKSGNITCAKPCLTCYTALKNAGIETIVYTDKIGPTTILLADMIEKSLKIYSKFHRD